MKRKPPLMAGLAVAALLVAFVCSAQIPAKLNYQVMLTDDADQPLVNESVQLVFRLYDVEAGGGSLWNETHNVVTNSIGVVSVVLGSTSPLTISFDAPLWLQVAVDGEIMSPRRELTSAPYALSSGGSGGGDGHSLDASDGSPVDALYVDGNGDVGIGTTSPQAELHVREEIQVGSTATLGKLTVHGGSAALGTISLEGQGVYGGDITISNGSGELVAKLGSSAHAGGGGSLSLTRNNQGHSGVFITGNAVGDEAPLLSLFGPLQMMEFYTGAADNDQSVFLPSASINATEILDEPGIASSVEPGSASFTGSMQSLDVRSITAPTNGYILAIGTAELGLYHVYNTSNNTTSVQVGLTDSYPSVATSQTTLVSVPDRAGTGTYRQAATVHGVFPATAGQTKTVRMYAWRTTGNNGYYRNVHITLLFIPTARGTVETISASSGPGEEPATHELPDETRIENHRGDSVTVPRATLESILSRLEQLEGRTNASSAGR